MFVTCRRRQQVSPNRTARHHQNTFIWIFTHLQILYLTLKQDFGVLRSDRCVSFSTTLWLAQGGGSATGLLAARSGGSKPTFFSSPKRPDWLLGLPSRQLFSGSRWWSSGRGVIATTHRHLLPRLRTRGAIPLSLHSAGRKMYNVDTEGCMWQYWTHIAHVHSFSDLLEISRLLWNPNFHSLPQPKKPFKGPHPESGEFSIHLQTVFPYDTLYIGYCHCSQGPKTVPACRFYH